MTWAAHEIPPKSIAILGAGIIGLSAAFRLAEQGLSITIYDPGRPKDAASWAAAGMLAPAFEAAEPGSSHPDLFAACLAGAKAWPDFAADLEAASGLDVGVSFGRTVAIAQTEAEYAELETLRLALHRRRVRHDRLDVELLKTLDPALSGEVLAALRLRSDGQSDNRAVLEALRTVLGRMATVRFCNQSAELVYRGNRIIAEGHDAVLVAAGWKSGEIEVRDGEAVRPLSHFEPSLTHLRPVSGQMLSVVPKKGQTPRETLRCGRLYIVPKADRVVIGATVEPNIVTLAPEKIVAAGLLVQACRFCPGLEGAEIIETWAGVRPFLPDHAPMIGAGQSEGVWLATGHYRNGILLAPFTADLLAAQILRHTSHPFEEAFAPARFLTATA